MRILTCLAAAAAIAWPQDGKKNPGWGEAGGGPERTNSYAGRMPPALKLSWQKAMGCPMPGRAQFVAGGGFLFGSSP